MIGQKSGSVAIEMEPANHSEASLHTQSAWTGGNSDHRQSLAEALTKHSGYVLSLQFKFVIVAF